MKCLYWNMRGITNSPTKLALKRTLTVHKPDVLFIAEPWMSFNDFPPRWLSRLGLKMFVINTRIDLEPNLWCFCLASLNPEVISVVDQHVSFLIKDQNIICGITAVYASTSHVTRRSLWQNLNNLLVDHNILGLHDKVNAAESNLTWVQEKTIEEGYSDRLAELERSAQSQLDLALFIEELFWKEKGKVNQALKEIETQGFFIGLLGLNKPLGGFIL